jgi:hypothetical protein
MRRDGLPPCETLQTFTEAVGLEWQPEAPLDLQDLVPTAENAPKILSTTAERVTATGELCQMRIRCSVSQLSD